jgi:DNA repair photolyase
MTFHEVRAKSIINRVPTKSMVPFEWTINPYRGCSHACVYCLAGDTRILLADGTTRLLANLRVGDDIIGTVRDGRTRRYVATKVLAHWSTVKSAFRVTLHDGTTLIASADHRFLSERGWKHVTGAMQGAGRRPHLTTANRLAGVGGFAVPPAETPDYRRGYLCGFVHGDGHVGPVDAAALARARDYATRCGGLHPLTADDREFSGASVRTASSVLDWPDQPTRDWRRGLLAGLFDADGSFGPAGALQFGVADKVLLDWVVESLEALGFAPLIEDEIGAHGIRSVRLLGGLRERLRFRHGVGPTTATGPIAGEPVHGDERLRVADIEPLGLEVPMFDITTGTGDFIADGVVSHNCFARNTHTYLDLDAGHDFNTQVVVKVNAGELLRKELGRPRWTGAHIAMGTNVDVYQRAEGRYQLMREILTALRDFANPFSILTKGTLIARDLDLLRQAAEVTSVGLSMSIGFVDEALWRSVEPGTPSPRRRLDVVKRLTDAGFAVGVLMAPILPGLTDNEESLEATVAALADAGAASITPLSLHLRPGAKEWYAAWLAREHPELVPRYRALYGKRAYLDQTYTREVSARVRRLARRYGVGERGSAAEMRGIEPPPPGPDAPSQAGPGAPSRAKPGGPSQGDGQEPPRLELDSRGTLFELDGNGPPWSQLDGSLHSQLDGGERPASHLGGGEARATRSDRAGPAPARDRPPQPEQLTLL